MQTEELLETTSIEETSVLGKRCKNKKKVSGYVYIDKEMNDNEEESIFNIQALDIKSFWQKYWYLMVRGLAIIAIGYTFVKNRNKEEI